jgi:hypothetical protein
LSGEQGAPSLDVVPVPEKELERLGIVLDIEEIVHEVVQRAGLVTVSAFVAFRGTAETDRSRPVFDDVLEG